MLTDLAVLSTARGEEHSTGAATEELVRVAVSGRV